VFLWQGSGWTRYLRKVPEFWFTFLIETFWGKRRIMEVYLNVAETGIGTYGAESGARRYFRKSASQLSRVEAARLAAALPLPKKRAVSGASGFTRRYGNTISARIGVVKRDGLDGCIYK
jgi:monofunctional glycosyltransferase